MTACVPDVCGGQARGGEEACASDELWGVMRSHTCCRRWLPSRQDCTLCFHVDMLSLTTGASLGALLCCSLPHVLRTPLPQGHLLLQGSCLIAAAGCLLLLLLLLQAELVPRRVQLPAQALPVGIHMLNSQPCACQTAFWPKASADAGQRDGAIPSAKCTAVGATRSLTCCRLVSKQAVHLCSPEMSACWASTSCCRLLMVAWAVVRLR